MVQENTARHPVPTSLSRGHLGRGQPDGTANRTNHANGPPATTAPSGSRADRTACGLRSPEGPLSAPQAEPRVSVPSLRRCPAYRKAPARAGALRTLARPKANGSPSSASGLHHEAHELREGGLVRSRKLAFAALQSDPWACYPDGEDGCERQFAATTGLVYPPPRRVAGLSRHSHAIERLRR